MIRIVVFVIFVACTVCFMLTGLHVSAAVGAVLTLGVAAVQAANRLLAAIPRRA